MCRESNNSPCHGPWALPIKTLIRNAQKPAWQTPRPARVKKRTYGGSGGTPRPLKREGRQQQDSQACTNLLAKVRMTASSKGWEDSAMGFGGRTAPPERGGAPPKNTPPVRMAKNGKNRRRTREWGLPVETPIRKNTKRSRAGRGPSGPDFATDGVRGAHRAP
jgi:hypothetical protein